MNIKDYIASGIIESYVLGLASAEEAAELELLATQHVEVRQALDEFASGLENFALQNTVAPPIAVKHNLMAELAGEFQDDAVVAPSGSGKLKTVPAGEKTPLRVITMWRFIAAASIILLVISAALNFYFYSNYKDSDTRYQALLQNQNTLQANNNRYQTRMLNLQQSIDKMADSNMVEVKMPGTKGKENNLATVFWNSKTNEVYFYNNHLAPTPENKQYQLWAIVDGKPVDAGVIESCDGLCHMKPIKGAQAFAITLERIGGSPTPTLTEMYVLGKV